MGSSTDPAWQVERIHARQLLSSVGATPPSSPYQYDENVDSTHPMYIDFVLPANVQPNFAKLSFKFRLYRTYSTLTLSNTGAGSAHGHPHSTTHGHTIAIGGGGGAATLSTNGAAGASIFDTTAGPAFNTGQIVNLISPGSTDNESSHTHSVSGTSILGVAESGITTTISAIAIDGTDVTASLGGGPWASDTVDLDLTSLMPTGNGAWHTISLTVTSLGRVVAILRLG